MSKAKSVKKPADPFQSSAVITRKRLHDDHHEALSIAPRWAKLGGLVRDEDDMETADNVGAELVGKKYSRIDKLPPVGQAVVYELTRYGGNVTTQVNRPKGAVSSRIKLTKSRSCRMVRCQAASTRTGSLPTRRLVKRCMWARIVPTIDPRHTERARQGHRPGMLGPMRCFMPRPALAASWQVTW